MTQTESIVIHRRIAASPERLFKAWTDPAVLVKWFVTADNQQIGEAETDVRPGGAFRIVIQDPEDRFVAFGTYERVDPPHLLEFTWQWEESSIEKGVSLVTVELRPVGEETELTLTHARLASEKSVQSHTQGWTALMDRLGKFVTAN